MTDYENLRENVRALTSGVSNVTSILANASAAIFYALDDINWAGFYLLCGDVLELAPFQGKPACVRIPVGRGVCGTAAQKGETVSVRDVREFSGHIACDEESRSEIVVPMRKGGRVIGVLDIDSASVGRFTDADRAGLEAIVSVLEDEVF